MGAIFGFFLFFFLAMDLLFLGVIPLKSAVITILPIVGIVVGLVWAKFAPLGGRTVSAPPPVDAPPAAPPPF
jgi:hypothetical protein